MSSHAYALKRAKAARRCVAGSRDPMWRAYHLGRWQSWMREARSARNSK